MLKRNSYLASLISFIILNVFCGVPVQAQIDADTTSNHERLYQVELIVFARPEASSQEHWPSDLKLAYPENTLSLNVDAKASEYSFLSADQRLLNPQASTIARSGKYTLLYHQAWRQMIYARKTNLAISGGKTFNGHQELEGSISLSVGQYLRIQSNLWLTQFVPAGTSLTEAWPELPFIPNASKSETEKAQGFLIKRIVKISQERSMRSNEIHYIDHPLLGVIVKIIPVETTKSNE